MLDNIRGDEYNITISNKITKKKGKQMKKTYMTAQELAPIIGVSVAGAYVRIRQMNDELKCQGYQTIPGRIPIAYVKEKFYGVDFEEAENGR